ncbi:MAG: hypothetical protein VX278_01750 [Myxococcota bacterium]|nr:hypothetical protein [Myxococcota bacterium]
MNIFFFILFACMESKTDDTATETDTATEETETGETVVSEEMVHCPSLSFDECATQEQCELISASPVVTNDDGSICVDNSSQETIACEFAGCSADPTITVASSPDSDTCWVIPSGCLPEGWQTCGEYPDACE